MTDLNPGHCLGLFPCWVLGCVVLSAESYRRSGDWGPPASPHPCPPPCHLLVVLAMSLSLVFVRSEGAEQSDR